MAEKKILKHESFGVEKDLMRFINNNKIKRSDIQQITNSPMTAHVYYWAKENSQPVRGESF